MAASDWEKASRQGCTGLCRAGTNSTAAGRYGTSASGTSSGQKGCHAVRHGCTRAASLLITTKSVRRLPHFVQRRFVK